MPPDSDVQKEIEQLEQRFAENAQGLVFAHLADAYRRAGEFAKAEGLLLHGLKTHATYTSAYNVLGRVYLESERYADAHEQFSKVLELDPQNLIALRALGDLAARGGRLEDARSWYERMLQIDPRSKEAREGLDNLEADEKAAGKAAEAEDGGEPEEREDAVAPAPTPDVAAEPEAEQPPEEAAADAEEATQPWDFGEVFADMGAEEPPAEMGIRPIEDLVSDERVSESSDRADSSQPAPWEVGPEETVPADGSGEPGAGSESAEVSPPEAAPAEAAADGSKPGEGVFDLGDLDLGIMDDWTPGFLGGEKHPDAETSETEDILESLGEGLGFELERSPFEEDEFAEEEPAPGPDEPVVTETMAELYANQGLYQDALNVYRQLAESRPDDEGIQTRIAELEAQLAEPRSDVEAGEEELAELLKLTQPATAEPFTAEPEEPEPEAEAIQAFSDAEPEVREIAGEAFEFEDEAPAVGIEHLDPFAGSFDVIAMAAKPSVPQEPDAAVEPSEPEVEEPSTAEAEMPTAFELSVGEAEGIAEALALAAEPEAGEDVIQEAAEEVAEALVLEVQEEEVEEEYVEPVVLEVEEDVEEEAVGAVTLEVEEEVAEAVVLEFEGEVELDVGEEASPDVEEEDAVQAMAAEEEPEPVLTPPDDEAVSGVDAWELAVEIAGEESGSELAAREFGAEIDIDEPAVEAETESALADFEASELVSDFAPPVPEYVSEPVSEEPAEYTIEDYLGGLLAYDAEAVSAEENAEGAEAVSESRPEANTAVSDAADTDTAGSEDLEQFQEWLRSLKR